MIDYLASLAGGLDTNMTSFNTYYSDQLVKAHANGQVIVLRAVLQQLTGISGVSVTTGTSPVNKVFTYNKAEGTSIYTTNKSEGTVRTYTWNKSELPDAYDFNVSIPFEDATTDVINQVTTYTKQFKLAGKTFNVTDDLMIANVTIPSASILTGFATPVTLIAAPGAGQIIVPIQISIKYKFATAAYATNTTIEFKLGSVSLGTVAAMISQAADRYTVFDPVLAVTAGPLENQALSFNVQTGNPTAGGGNLQIMIVYKLQTVV